MTRLGCAAVLVAALAIGAASLRAQQSMPDAASIAGITTDADGQPVPRAVVQLSGSTLAIDLLTVSNDEGRFSFAGLPAGRFALAASKPPFLPASLGSLTPTGGSDDALVLEAGQRMADVRLMLARGGVISGRVTDRYGRPLPNAPIVAMQFRTVNGERTLWSLGQQSPPTNSRGEYRVYGLAAGSYLVMAFEPGDYLWFLGRTPGPVSRSGGAMSGADVRPTTAADVEWAVQQLSRPSVPGLATAGPPPPPRGPGVSQGATYYPGTVDPERAVLVSVRAGEETAAIDFAAHGLPTARITGRVIGSDGRPAARVRLAVSGGGSTSSRPLADDGSFVLAGVAPGELTLVATVPGSSLSATRTLAVAGQDITDVVLTLQPGP
jgi:hypothetical protein